MTNMTYRRRVIETSERLQKIEMPMWGIHNRPLSKKITCVLECGHTVEKNISDVTRVENRRVKMHNGVRVKSEGLHFICPWCESHEDQQID